MTSFTPVTLAENEPSLWMSSQKAQAGNIAKSDKDRKIGHRRVNDAGQVTYKKKTTSELMSAIQLGIGQSVGWLAPKARRDVLYSDFHIVETVFYPHDGGPQTPAHHCSDFCFKTYAPVAFQYFRELFDIRSDDYMLSLCNEPLRELSNPGASGSIFYITNDDEFIIKTVQHKEAEFLQKLLPGYYMNLNQNRATLLPKFYGLYCYQCSGKNIRLVVMNNLLPSSFHLHAKYDLKGSTHKRRASNLERTKPSPTYKDLDFVEQHADGLLLEFETHEALKKTIERDCRVLQSFKIMDYSMLLAVHNIDQAARDKTEVTTEPWMPGDVTDGDHSKGIMRWKSVKQQVSHYSTVLEMADGIDIPSGGIPAKNARGDRLLLFIGIIDILQSYRLSKKLEHTLKAMVSDADTISVHRPGFYAQRFQSFIGETVFRKLPPPLRHSPSKRKSVDRQKSLGDGNVMLVSRDLTSVSMEADADQGAVGGQPDVLSSVDDTVEQSTSADIQQHSPDADGATVLLLQQTVSPSSVVRVVATVESDHKSPAAGSGEQPSHTTASSVTPIRRVVSDAGQCDTSLRWTFVSSSAVSTDVNSATDVTSRGYLPSSSGDTSDAEKQSTPANDT